jgi:hypothetical protein
MKTHKTSSLLRNLLRVCCIFISSNLCAQSVDFGFGARSKALGDANTTIADSWAMFNNIGGISGVKAGSVGFAFNQYFDVDGFNAVAVGIVQPTTYGNIGISALRFGDELYNEQLYSIGFGNKIGFVRLGFRANYYQVYIDEYGTAAGFLMDFGGIVELSPQWSFGASVSNFTASTLNDLDNAALPVVMKIGISYKASENVSLLADLVKDVEFDPEIRAGIEYWINQKLALRTGINSQPFAGFAGFGLKLKQFEIDYAVSSHQFLGFNHQLSVVFQYQKNNDK